MPVVLRILVPSCGLALLAGCAPPSPAKPATAEVVADRLPPEAAGLRRRGEPYRILLAEFASHLNGSLVVSYVGPDGTPTGTVYVGVDRHPGGADAGGDAAAAEFERRVAHVPGRADPRAGLAPRERVTLPVEGGGPVRCARFAGRDARYVGMRVAEPFTMETCVADVAGQIVQVDVRHEGAAEPSADARAFAAAIVARLRRPE